MLIYLLKAKLCWSCNQNHSIHVQRLLSSTFDYIFQCLHSHIMYMCIPCTCTCVACTVFHFERSSQEIALCLEMDDPASKQPVRCGVLNSTYNNSLLIYMCMTYSQLSWYIYMFHLISEFM